MDKAKLQDMANTAFQNIGQARTELFNATENAIQAKVDLETEKAKATLSGRIDGKNAETREAQLKEYLVAFFDALTQAEKAERKARHAFDLASIDVDTVKTLLRIAELV